MPYQRLAPPQLQHADLRRQTPALIAGVLAVDSAQSHGKSSLYGPGRISSSIQLLRELFDARADAQVWSLGLPSSVGAPSMGVYDDVR
ncbi:hypothetical protein KC356_g285 [Hortaea werneckii]|nr:hypothetical protein KC356_g285 [Hortaea werneckii]